MALKSNDLARRPWPRGWGLAAAAGLLALILNAAALRVAWSNNLAYLRLDALLNRNAGAVTLQPPSTEQDWLPVSAPASFASASSPARFVAAYGLGLTELAQGHYAPAISAFQAALAAYPEYPGTHALLADADHGDGDDNAAVAQWSAAQAQPLLLSRGDAAGQAGDWKTAAGWYLLATRVDPRSASAFWKLGQAYSSAGERQPAVDALQMAVSLAPDNVPILYTLGLTYFRQGALAAAAAQFKRVLALQPNEYNSTLNLAGVELSLGQLDAAQAYGLRAAQLGPDDPRAHFALGSVYARRAQWPAAINELKTAISLIDPWDRATAAPFAPANKAAYHLLLAQTYQSAGQTLPAIAEYQAVLMFDPKNAAALAALKALPAPGQP